MTKMLSSLEPSQNESSVAMSCRGSRKSAVEMVKIALSSKKMTSYHQISVEQTNEPITVKVMVGDKLEVSI